ncbi:hypothetical protein NA57DRAFT_70336 [Rhizodiscina lignyota]|uniref:Uncharacterized protein n=1 Tax=Rhizodiscina lignyota TaxID=1504668 RepID=A0A9P4MG32_9PEZI|nr:hypothetical protein NA57DRAFT_70336 [Rhizodiscina lignyota]
MSSRPQNKVCKFDMVSKVAGSMRDTYNKRLKRKAPIDEFGWNRRKRSNLQANDSRMDATTETAAFENTEDWTSGVSNLVRDLQTDTDDHPAAFEDVREFRRVDGITEGLDLY